MTKRFFFTVTIAAAAFLALACDPPDYNLEMETLSPEQGWSVHIPPFEVPHGEEVQDCYFIEMPQVGDDEELWVNKVRIGMNPGSHHFNMYRVTTTTELDPKKGVDFDMGGIPAKLIKGGPCFDSSNFNEWPLIINSQVSTEENPYLDWELPEGVAFKLTAGELIMLQPHYVNVASQKTPYKGQIKVNFYRAKIEEPVELGTLFATQQSIRVCQSTPDATYYGTCAFPAADDIRIAAVNGHFHLRGNRFSIALWDGISTERPPASSEFYESYTWEDPVMSTGIDIPVPPGGGIWWTCEYRWRPPTTSCERVNELDEEQQNDCCYTFGPTVSTQEHCNVFLYYWPKQDSGDIFCN